MPDWVLTIIIAWSVVLVLFIIYFIFTGAVFTKVSFKRREGDKDFAKNEDPRAKKDPDRIWYFSQTLEELNLESYDRLNIKGYFLNNKSNKLAILVHGYHGRYYSVVSQARIFFENGFDVLCINNRTHDTSEGNLITMGKREARDVNDWIKLMLKRNPNYHIALYGISMGGHIVMRVVSDKNVNQNIKCVIEDCGYNSLKKQLHHMLMLRQIKLSKFILNLSELYSILFHHFSFSNTISKRFKNLKMPILLFHGGKDDYVPTENINLNYDAVPEGIYKEKHIFEDSVHTKCVVDHKQEYKEIVDNFVNKYIK